MKNFILILLVAIGLITQSCENSNSKGISTDVVNNSKSAVKTAKEGTVPEMLFEETVHDFGDMIRGEKVSYSFKFVNIGGSDLVITRVSTSCGCTVSEYPKEPIAPGKEGAIEVTFDSAHKKGFQNKTITVLANTEPNTTTLRVKTKVIMPEKN